MNDDALRALWSSSQATGDTGATYASTIDDVLLEDRVATMKERRVRVLLAAAVILLCPLLLWSAAHGRTPLVRGGYGLMAVGVSLVVFAEWLFLRWSRQGLPGPADTRSQVQLTVLVLTRQADLLKMAPVWCVPIFIGVGMISVWIIQERSAIEGAALAALTALGWAGTAAIAFVKGRALEDRRRRLARLLSDLSTPPAK